MQPNDFHDLVHEARINRARAAGDYPACSIPPNRRDLLLFHSTAHLIEEAVEAQRHLNRREWRPQPSPVWDAEARSEFLEELADVYLMLDSTLYYLGASWHELEAAVLAKITKNNQRSDNLHAQRN